MITTDDLDQMKYLPIVRSRQAELRGYRELNAVTKASLTPLVSLGKHHSVDSVPRVLEKVRESVGRCFVDLHQVAHQTCVDEAVYANSTGNFAAWRDLFDRDGDIVPVALLRQGLAGRPFVRQLLEIEKSFGVVAMRSRNLAVDLQAIQTAIAAIDDVNNMLVVLDFGYIRGAVSVREIEARSAITAIRTIDPEVRIAVAASSYPRSVSAYGESGGLLSIEERDFHIRIGGDEVAIYGDHSSIYPEPFEPERSRFVPRIDYCLDDAWVFRRHRDTTGGYGQCARDIVELPDWDPIFAEEVWGAARIQEAATSVPAGFNAPANWIAARVNMHIERQCRVALAPDVPEDEFEDI